MQLTNDILQWVCIALALWFSIDRWYLVHRLVEAVNAQTALIKLGVEQGEPV